MEDENAALRNLSAVEDRALGDTDPELEARTVLLLPGEQEHLLLYGHWEESS